MHSAVARHNDRCNQPVILGDGTNLCLQAEIMEDQILMLYYGVFPLVSDSVNYYALIAVIILTIDIRDSTGTV